MFASVLWGAGKCDNCEGLLENLDREYGLGLYLGDLDERARRQRKDKVELELGREAVLLLTAVSACGGRFGINLPIDVLRGSKVRRV